MSHAGLALYGILAVFLGALIGWHSRRAYGSHGDLKLSKGRVPTFRRNRNRAGLLAVGLVIVALVLVKVLTF
jgi:hypothetical protein